MPIWQLDELNVCHGAVHSHVPSNLFHELLSIYGPVPRLVFPTKKQLSDYQTTSAAVEDAKRSISRAISQSPDLVAIANCVASISCTSMVPHLLMHLHAELKEDGRTHEFVDFASSYVREAVVDALLDSNINSVKLFFDQTAWNGQFGLMRGGIWERYVHRMLALGGTFRIRQLGSSVISELKIEPTPITSQRKKVDFVDKTQMEQLADNVYSLPTNPQQGAVDSVIKPNKIFQITIDMKHGIKQHLLKQVLDALPASSSSYHLFFVVPSSVFPIYQPQQHKTLKDEDHKQSPPGNVVQYALEVRWELKSAAI
jgi:hypothetical protein